MPDAGSPAAFNALLARNERLRLKLPLPLLFCYALYNIYKWGFAFYAGEAMSLYGRAPLPVSGGIAGGVILSGYLFSALLMYVVPRKTVLIMRSAAACALLCALGLFLPVSSVLAYVVLQIAFFCCVILLSFELCLASNLFSLDSAFVYLFGASPAALFFVGLLQNDFYRPPFWVFHVSTILSLALALFFFCRLPARVWPAYPTKKDRFVFPGRLYLIFFCMILVMSFLAMAELTFVETVTHGTMTYWLACLPVGLAFVILRRAVKLSYFALLPILSGLQVLGGLLAYCSLLKPVFALPACFCMCAGWLLVLYEMFLALMLSRRFPLRFPPSVFILMIAIAVMATVGILDLVRENLRILYGIFLAVPIAFTVVWFSIQPYFLFLLEGSLGNEEPETRSAVRGPVREIRLFGTLTARERETAELMLQGFSYTEIAKKLNIAPSTVISHRKTLYGKLGIDSKRELFDQFAEERKHASVFNLANCKT